MKSYSETVFPEAAIQALILAELAVFRLPNPEAGQRPWRCHEVTRVVAGFLESRKGKATIEVIDGSYGAMFHASFEHSWIILDIDRQRFILDAYAIGRLPQVQLLDIERGLCAMYMGGRKRRDIDHAWVKKMLDRVSI
jgi:hypothetical protein